MPVIRVTEATTSTLPPPEVRASLLTKLRDEFTQSTEHGPVIFEIPLGTECFDVLVVWEEWAEWPPDERSHLVLDAYEEDRRSQIARVTGVTYVEAMQQQLLPYAIQSTLEREHKMTFLLCDRDENKVQELMAKIRNVKVTNGGIISLGGTVELRFPTRATADSVLARLQAADPNRELYWSVVV